MEEIASTFVVVGGGIAGVSCCEGLSFLCPDANIMLVTTSSSIKAVTNLVNLTKTLTQFDVEERQADTLTEMYPLISVLHDACTSIDPQNHSIYTETGKCITYQKLCICTGARPKLILENNPHVIGLRDTESVNEFQKRIAAARRILIVGNGGIATEIIHEVEAVEMIWIIKDKHISATFVDPGAAEFFQTSLLKESEPGESDAITKRMAYTISADDVSSDRLTGPALGPDWHRNLNVRGNWPTRSKVSIEYECEVKKILNEEESRAYIKENVSWPVYAELTNGKVFGCDFIVSATGVVPNNEVAKELLTLADDGGLLVNWMMETSAVDVYAAGDVCTASWDKAQHWFQMRLWTQARQMGFYAAKCMAASLAKETVLQDFCFELFSHVTRFFGYKVVLLGLYNGQTLGGEYEILLRMTKKVEYIKLVMKGGKLQGAVLIGDTDLEEMCENLILNQLDLSVYGEDLLNPNIDIEDYFD